MTVKELIAILEDIPPTHEVVILTCNCFVKIADVDFNSIQAEIRPAGAVVAELED